MSTASAELSPQTEGVKTEPAWTPGEWRAVTTGSNMRENYSQPFGVASGYTNIVAGCFGDTPCGEEAAEANAHLFAAAKNHHAASVSTVERLTNFPKWIREAAPEFAAALEEELAKHRKAIAKARGERA